MSRPHTTLEQALKEHECIELLTKAGYIITPPGFRGLSCHRTEPFPDGVDFKQEALNSLRSQLTLDHIHFSQRIEPAQPWPGGHRGYKIHTARLVTL